MNGYGGLCVLIGIDGSIEDMWMCKGHVLFGVGVVVLEDVDLSRDSHRDRWRGRYSDRIEVFSGRNDAFRPNMSLFGVRGVQEIFHQIKVCRAISGDRVGECDEILNQEGPLIVLRCWYRML